MVSDAPARDGTGATALVVEHLTKRFGDRVAFDDVSFEVGYGEVFGFLGPNGAGKPELGLRQFFCRRSHRDPRPGLTGRPCASSSY
jgi:ABC-type transporter Mla maintaining outer membrane lipid asymmetry ATPase subunit MlaF